MTIMTHRRAGNAQIGLSYFFLTGFFIALGLYAVGVVKVDIMHFLEGGLTMILSFWFMRQRTTGDEPTIRPEPEQPSDPKASLSLNPNNPPRST